ncbi:hypothetical protein FI667_g5371, partial [Globisporangium splendens]
MADYEGYLLLHDAGRYADPLYFELESGVLSYYTKKSGKWLGQYSLTRHRVVARAMAGSVLSPNRFSIEFCPVRSIHDTERSLKGFKRMTVVLSGSSQQVTFRWIHAIQTWRRRNWRDSVVIQDCDDEAKALRMLMCMHKLELKITKMEVADVPPLRKVEVAPEQDDRESLSVDKRNLMLASSLSHFNRLSFHNRTSTTTIAL